MAYPSMAFQSCLPSFLLETNDSHIHIFKSVFPGCLNRELISNFIIKAKEATGIRKPIPCPMFFTLRNVNTIYPTAQDELPGVILDSHFLPSVFKQVWLTPPIMKPLFSAQSEPLLPFAYTAAVAINNFLPPLILSFILSYQSNRSSLKKIQNSFIYSIYIYVYYIFIYVYIDPSIPIHIQIYLYLYTSSMDQVLS